jgi:Fe-S-cluster containining protein
LGNLPPWKEAVGMSMRLITETHMSGGALTQKDGALVSDGGSYCLECARRGHTCCQQHDIYVTNGDCQRIHLESGSVNFFEYRGCAFESYADQGDDPVWQYHVFRPDGTRRVLKQKQNGDCLFLSQRGCALSLNSRPLICRLYPRIYSAGGLERVWDSDCPAAHGDPQALIEDGIDGVRWQEATIWHHMLYTEVTREGKENEDRIDL